MTDLTYFSDIIPISQIQGEDFEETVLLKNMSLEADKYISSFRWTPAIKEKYFGFGIGGIVSIFLYHFAVPINDNDEWLWVITGDLPSAYLVVDNATSPMEALRCYCDLMYDWANKILDEKPLDTAFPVQADPNFKNAEMLLSRVNFLRSEIIQ